MRRYILLIFTALTAFFCISCEENITLDLPEYENKLAVYCILQQDSTPILYLNRSKSYFDYSDTSHELQYIPGATVVITDVSSGVYDTLVFRRNNVNGSREYLYKGKLIIKNGQRYILNIWHKDKHVSAETTVPNPVEITGFNNRMEEHDYFGEKEYNGNIDVKFIDEPGKENAYTLYITEPHYIPRGPGQFDSFLNTLTYEYFNFDRGTDGKEMQNEFYGNYSTNNNPVNSYSVSVEVLNYTAETATYLESIREQEYARGDPTAEPVLLKHNIVGGLGIFGSFSISKQKQVKIW